MTRSKILILTSDLEITAYLQSFIPLLGNYHLEIASSPVEMLAKINALEPELILLDIESATPQTPSPVLKEIFRNCSKSRLLAIVADHEGEEMLKKEGIDDIISRPFDFTDLSQRIKGLLPLQPESGPSQEYARLLVADDESAISQLLSDVFSPLGIEVYTASNGQEALDVFKEKFCNLAIVDLAMPVMGGNELVKILQSSTNPPKPKSIVIITACLGHAFNELQRLGYPVLAKPMDIEILEQEILKACEKHGLALKK